MTADTMYLKSETKYLFVDFIKTNEFYDQQINQMLSPDLCDLKITCKDEKMSFIRKRQTD